MVREDGTGADAARSRRLNSVKMYDITLGIYLNTVSVSKINTILRMLDGPFSFFIHG